MLLAGRGDGLGGAVSQTMRLAERHRLTDFAEAVALAHAANTPHPNNLRLLLEKIRHRRGLPEPMLAPVVTHPRLRNLHVRPHAPTDHDRPNAACVVTLVDRQTHSARGRTGRRAVVPATRGGTAGAETAAVRAARTK